MFKTVSALVVCGSFVFGGTPSLNLTVISGSIVAAGGGLFIPVQSQVIFTGAVPI